MMQIEMVQPKEMAPARRFAGPVDIIPPSKQDVPSRLDQELQTAAKRVSERLENRSPRSGRQTRPRLSGKRRHVADPALSNESAAVGDAEKSARGIRDRPLKEPPAAARSTAAISVATQDR